MLDKSEGSYEQKQTQRDNLREVIQYCENKIDCRRCLILRYFGENFDRSVCSKTCDNCESQKAIKSVDFTSSAKEVLKLSKLIFSNVLAFIVDIVYGVHDQITLNHLIDIYRGSAAKRIAKYQGLPGAGKGKSLSRVDVERLVQCLCTKQVLKEYCVSNKMGFVSTYVKIGPFARQLDNGQMKIILTTTEDLEGPSNGGSGDTTNQTAWPSRKRSSKSVNDNGSVKVTKKTKATNVDYAASTSAKVSKSSATKIPPPLNQNCYDMLMRKRTEICSRENIQCHHFLSNAAIIEIARQMPKSVAELQCIKGVDGRQISKYGSYILSICQNV